MKNIQELIKQNKNVQESTERWSSYVRYLKRKQDLKEIGQKMKTLKINYSKKENKVSKAPIILAVIGLFTAYSFELFIFIKLIIKSVY